MFIELHITFTGEPVLIKIENILYIKDLLYMYPGKIESEKGTEVGLNAYDCTYDKTGCSYKNRIRFCVTETVEQITKMMNGYICE